jgi:hypothetical protein
VREGYGYFTKYNFLGFVCIHSMNFISTQVLINSLNLAIPKSISYSLSAGLNWILKEIFGQLGGIIFSSLYSNKFERQIRQWRLISLNLFNFAIILEVCTMAKPEYFLLLASAATACKIII